MELAVDMRHITMRFPRVVANRDVNFSVRKGEIHALVGENGAGKSTLMNILYGLYQPTEGEVWVDGQKAQLHSAVDAIQLGIGMVHQHFMLIPRLTVAQNVVLGAEPRTGDVVNRSKMYDEVQQLSDRYGFSLSVREKVRNISLGMQQRVEIAKALYRKANIIILDEPTAVLTPQEIDELGKMLKRLKELGKTIIIITHKLKEVMAFSDRVTVLRAGEVVDTVETLHTSAEEITRLMVGRDLVLERRDNPHIRDEVMLEFDHVSYRDRLHDVCFQVRKGEILGLAGIDNSGQKEITELMAGIIRPTSGRILLDGQDITELSITERKKRGIGFIPQDRQSSGLVLDMSVANNLVLGYEYQDQYHHGICINYKVLASDAEKKIQEYDIRPADAAVAARTLSGGNQQKVVVARESSRASRLIVADQPTRGVDIGASELIYDVFYRAVAQSKAVFLSSLELDEVMLLSDRIAVIEEGRITGIVDARTATRHQIGKLMTSGEEEVTA